MWCLHVKPASQFVKYAVLQCKEYDSVGRFKLWASFFGLNGVGYSSFQCGSREQIVPSHLNLHPM